MIYFMQNIIWTLYKIALSEIKLYFIKIFAQMIISCNSFEAFVVHMQLIDVAKRELW